MARRGDEGTPERFYAAASHLDLLSQMGIHWSIVFGQSDLTFILKRIILAAVLKTRRGKEADNSRDCLGRMKGSKGRS